MNKLIIGNLVHRPLRSIISAFAVAIEVIMILSIAAIMFGMLDASRNQQAGVGGDMIVRPGASSAIISTSAAAADVRVGDVLGKLPHVEAVSPVNIKINTAGAVENIYGIDYQSYDALRPFVFKAGTPFQQPYDIIVDDPETVGDRVLDYCIKQIFG